jgi:tetratricopeptide (TPR) repeat protein
MSEKNNLVKKESLIYALLIGFVIGFIGGAIFAVYKLAPSNSPISPKQQQTQQAASNSEQLSNQTTEAIANFEAEVTAKPDNVAAWTQLGHLYYDSDQVEKAIKAYTRSLELKPDNADVWTDLGVMYRRNKQPEKAIESFEKAFSVNPKHEPSRLNKGIVLLYDFNKPEEAIAAWEEMLAINPEAKLNNGKPLTEAIEAIRKEMESSAPPKK